MEFAVRAEAAEDVLTKGPTVVSIPELRYSGRDKIYDIFIGSPRGCKRARKVFDYAKTTANRILRPEHIRFNLLSEEDVPPGCGRPQDRINKLIDNTALAVFIFGDYFGQPTGEFLSGTYEELQYALRHNRETGGVPEIWVIFKKNDPAKLDEQARYVLQFKTELEKSTPGLYFKEISEPDLWGMDLVFWLKEFAGKINGV